MDRFVTRTEGGRKIVSDRLLYAAGRLGNTNDLGLEEELGIKTDSRGFNRGQRSL